MGVLGGGAAGDGVVWNYVNTYLGVCFLESNKINGLHVLLCGAAYRLRWLPRTPVGRAAAGL